MAAVVIPTEANNSNFHLRQLAGAFALITDWEFVIGGTNYAPNFTKGSIICTPITSAVETSQTKRHTRALREDGLLGITEASFIRYTLQLDFYKRNADEATEIEAFSEALRVREALKSWQFAEYLARYNAEILTNYGIISSVSEMIDNKLINRAFFDFAIVSKYEVSEGDEYFTEIKLKSHKI